MEPGRGTPYPLTRTASVPKMSPMNATTYTTPDGIRARAIAEVRIPATIDALIQAREHLSKIPVIYDVHGQCLYQAIDDVRDALAKLRRMRDAL